MKINYTLCESCRIRPVEKSEPLEEGMPPYRLCEKCHERLINYALRPLEFFNLAAIHGHSYFLHDDFYDFDTGEATQPKTAVEEPDRFPFPDLHAIKTNLEKATDFACVQYFTSSEVIELLKKFDKKAILNYIKFKVDYNRSINYKAFEIAAQVLASYAADWVREQWNNQHENELLDFAPALAACLPFNEAFAIVTTEIEGSPQKSFADNSSALLYFRSGQTLDWLENVKDRIINVSSIWGVLVAASMFDWPRAKKWLEEGRPLSLIALDALLYCTTTGNRHNQSLWLLEHPPTLLKPVEPEDMVNTITTYLKKDNAPRSKETAKQIIDNLASTARQ
ncbi:MAG: hypothetical protein INR73_07020 [Williamsia sp.]|nr:hypothetical protein [Williamsia sp.]